MNPLSSRAIPLLLGLLAAGLLSLSLVPGDTRAQGNQPSPHLSGTWRLATPAAQAAQSIEAAVAPAVAPLRPDMQRLARSRLAESTWVPSQLVIQATAAQISVQVIGQENRTFTSTPGQPQNVYSRSGVRASMTQLFRPDGGLEQQLRAMDGTQYNFYIPSTDGRTLNLDVLIQAQQLSQDVRFRVAFTRQ